MGILSLTFGVESRAPAQLECPISVRIAKNAHVPGLWFPKSIDSKG